MTARKKIQTFVSNTVSKIIEKTQDHNSFVALKSAVRFLGSMQVQTALNNSCCLVNQVDGKYKTILDYAIERGSPEVIKVVVKSKGKVSLSFYNARDGLELADIFSTLKKAGYDFNALDMLGFAPIHYASMGGYEKALKFLTKTDVDFQAVDVNGCSPIMISLRGKNNGFLVRGHC